MSKIPQLPEPTPVRDITEIVPNIVPNPYDVFPGRMDDFIPNPFAIVSLPEEMDAMPNPLSTPTPVDLVINPFATMRPNLTVVTGAASDDGGFKYTQFYITQVTIYPCIFFMVFFSLVIIFIIMKQLKPVMKLYMSVIYYAFSMLFYASQILGVLVFDLLNPGRIPDCSSPSDQIRISVQIAGLIMPSIAVLVITTVRLVFLMSPFHWRDLLSYRRQLTGFLLALITSFLIGFTPLMGLCDLTMYQRVCVLEKNSSSKCVMCFGVVLGLGLIVPVAGVIVMYGGIYRIIIKARKFKRSMTGTTEMSSLTEGDHTEGSKVGKEEKIKSERDSIPWSIIIILALSILTALPWAVLVTVPEIIYGRRKDHSVTFLTIDILYSLTLLSSAVSPLAYVLTTKVVRDAVISGVKKVIRCERYQDYDRI